jgi:diacylglycerol kinase (ATP)
MAENWFFIVNPRGGNGVVEKAWPKVSAVLQSAGIPFQYALTEGRRHAMELAESAIEKGFRRIVAVGGDGTNHEVANGILRQTKIPPETVTHALLPIGTGNDWARTHAIPGDLSSWVEMLKAYKTRLQDVGKVTYQQEGAVKERYFVNVLGMAYDAFVVRRLEEQGVWSGNKMVYLGMILRCLFQYSPQPARIWLDDELVVESPCYTINIGICRYSGGGMQFVPQADPFDGQLAFTVAKRVSKLGVIKAMPLFYNGKLDRHPQTVLRHANRVRVDSLDTPIPVEADGEYLGESPVTVEVLPQKLQIVVP